VSRRPSTELGLLRAGCGLTQQAVAARMGVTSQMVSKIETTGPAGISPSTLARYAQALGGTAVITLTLPAGQSAWPLTARERTP
jgi:transcriptional regulator with XRE-family HTH domain